jgi:putative transcriptional regulator
MRSPRPRPPERRGDANALLRELALDHRREPPLEARDLAPVGAEAVSGTLLLEPAPLGDQPPDPIDQTVHLAAGTSVVAHPPSLAAAARRASAVSMRPAIGLTELPPWKAYLTCKLCQANFTCMKNDVRGLRSERGLTQQQLGEEMGVSRQTINAIETERYTPSLPLAIALARFFATPVEEMFNGNPE